MQQPPKSRAWVMVGAVFVLFGSNAVQCQEVNSSNEHLRLNQLQYIGTHNSFHIEPEQAVSLLLRRKNVSAEQVQKMQSVLNSIRYTHLPLPTQLSLGIRKFELDILYDPAGKRFAEPAIHRALSIAGLPLEFHYDARGELDNPGFKIIHIPDLDVRSTCLTLSTCLRQVRDWSDHNVGHFPIVIQLEAKHRSTPALDPHLEAAEVLPFGEGAWRDLTEEILAVFPKEQLITPSSVSRKGWSLRRSVREHGWPTLRELAGKIMFTLDNTDDAMLSYMASSDRTDDLLFVSVNSEHERAAWMKVNDAFDPQIAELVSLDFMVRSRADANLVEAIENDVSRREKAFASGAHFIATDYPYSDSRISAYFVRFANDRYVRCNPVTFIGNCPF